MEKISTKYYEHYITWVHFAKIPLIANSLQVSVRKPFTKDIYTDTRQFNALHNCQIQTFWEAMDALLRHWIDTSYELHLLVDYIQIGHTSTYHTTRWFDSETDRIKHTTDRWVFIYKTEK